MDQFLDKFFIIFHTIYALFNILGWIWKKTRKLNLIFLLLTGFSWFILGIWYGIGYCPLTHWHWQIRHRLGYYDMPYSYIKFLLDTWTGLDWHPILVDVMTGTAFGSALIISIFLNIKAWIENKRSASSEENI